jgi:endonuclease/exonuclease/phosphatase family metal-dependent hydrolase
MAELRFVSWNPDNFSQARLAEKEELLRSLPWDVAALQECGRKTYELILSTLGDVDGVHALDVTPSSRRRNHYGCALLSRAGPIGNPQVWPAPPRPADVPEAPFPESCLSASIDAGGRHLTAVSFHAPHAAGRSRSERAWRTARKNAAYRHLVTGLNATGGTMIVGMDGNVWTDPVDLHVCHDDDPQVDVLRFHLADPPHQLTDVFRMWLASHPEEKAKLRRLHPDGPLATTYNRRKKGDPRYERMDRVYATADVAVTDVRHGYDEAIAAGSDHAYVYALLEVP